MDAEQIVLELVRENPGISGLRLAGEAMSRCYMREGDFPNVEWYVLLHSMVKRRCLIEIELVPPSSDRAISLYFPSETLIHIKGQ